MIEDSTVIKISDSLEFVKAKRVKTWETSNLRITQFSYLSI